MKNVFLITLMFLITSCSSNKEKQEIDEIPKSLEETASKSSQNIIDTIETALMEDSVIEPHLSVETELTDVDTSDKTTETIDPRIQRILDEKLTQEMKDSLQIFKSKKQ